MNKTQLIVAVLLIFSFSMTSCEKMEIEENGNTEEVGHGQENGRPITFSIAKLPQKTADGQTTNSVFTDLTLAVFQYGAIVDQIVQSAEDKDLGTCSMKLEDGNFTVIALAHNCGATIDLTKDPQKVVMPNDKTSKSNQKVTDSFWCNESITVDGSDSRIDLELNRIVAKFCLVIEDAMPSRVATMQFYYTGGSSTLNAMNGEGCVKSRQTVKFPITADMIGKPSSFEVYTFPREGSETLNMTVSALDANGNALYRKEFPLVSIAANKVTQYSGSFFGDGDDSGDEPGEGDISFDISINDDWDEQIDVSY